MFADKLHIKRFTFIAPSTRITNEQYNNAENPKGQAEGSDRHIHFGSPGDDSKYIFTLEHFLHQIILRVFYFFQELQS